MTDAGKVLADQYPDCGSSVKFKLAEEVAFDGQTVTIPLTFTPGDTNFAPVDVTLTITLTDKNIPTLTADSFTKVYDGAAVKAEDIKKTASAKGTWAFKDGAAPVNVSDSGTYTLVFTPTDDGYIEAEVNVSISITKATPTGTPKYSRITSAGKTLKDANLSADGMTPSGGTAQWLDSSTGAVLPDDTAVTARTSYRWLYTPSDLENYNTATGTVVLYTPSGGSSGGTSGGSSAGSSGGGTSSSSTSSNSTSSSTVHSGTTGGSVTVNSTASVSSGFAVVNVSTSDAQNAVNQAVQRGSGNVTFKMDVPSGASVNAVQAELPASALSSLSSRSSASLTVDTPLATVTIPNSALYQLSRNTDSVTVSAAAVGSNAVSISVEQDGWDVGTLSAGMKVELPITGAATSGVVAILVDSYGNETVLPKSIVNSKGDLAVLLETGTATIKYQDNSKYFYDVSSSHWSADAVDFVSSHGLFRGTTDTTFDGYVTMNRAMLVTVLHRLESTPRSGSVSFADVPQGSYYAEAAAWASSKGIVQGDGSGFSGSRAEVAQMLVCFVSLITQ